MKCINHPEADAANVCAKCGKGLCIYCVQEFYSKTYCQTCAQEVRTRVAEAIANVKESKTAGKLLQRKTPLIKLILLLPLYGGFFHPSFNEKNPADFSYLSIAASYCAVFGYFFLFLYLLFSFINVMSSTGDQSMPHWPVAGMIISYALAVIFGATALFRHPTKRSIKMASSVILLSIIPLFVIGVAYLANS